MYSINKVNTRNKTFWKLQYDLLKSILVTVKIIRSFSGHAVFLWVYNIYKSFPSVETYDILLETDNRFLKRLTQEFDTLFDYTFQEGPKLNILNINIIQSKYGISI